MSPLITLILFFVVIGVLAALFAKKPIKFDALSFTSRGQLFTPAERSFLAVLEQALDGRYRVFGKVRLGDIVQPGRGLSISNRTTASNKINQKHVDFVVCNASDLVVIGVVELDDKSHALEKRVARDEFVDHALTSALIPIARFQVKKGYVLQEVRAKLADAFALPEEVMEAAVVEEEVVSVQPEPVVVPETPIVQVDESAPVCAKCAAVMVKRQAKNGPYAGKFFWACSAYPKCRQVVAIG